MKYVTILAAVAAVASAAPAAKHQEKPSPIPEPMGTPCPTPSAEVEVTKPEAEKVSGICTNLPAGLQGLMVTDVAYETDALYTCAGKTNNMKIWCEEDAKTEAQSYWYCCGDACEHTEAMPEDRTCEVDGEEYRVGHAYNIKLDGKKVTMWCTSEDDYVTCDKKTCGSTPELTPPGIETCPVPQPPVVPEPPRPPMTCDACIRSGNTWDLGMNQCYEGLACTKTANSKCTRDIHDCYPKPPVDVCKVTPLEKMDCKTCVDCGNSWNLGHNTCHPGMMCPLDSLSKCTQNAAECGMPITPQ